MSVWQVEFKNKGGSAYIITKPFDLTYHKEGFIDRYVREEYNSFLGGFYNFDKDVKSVKHLANIPEELANKLKGRVYFSANDLKDTIQNHSARLKKRAEEAVRVIETLGL